MYIHVVFNWNKVYNPKSLQFYSRNQHNRVWWFLWHEVMSFVTNLRSLLGKYPLIPTSGLFFVLYGAGDLTKQVLLEKRKPREFKYDSAVRLGSIGGFVFAPMFHTWYKTLEKVLPGKTPLRVVQKMVCDQMLMAPLTLVLFFICYPLLEGKAVNATEVRKKSWQTYKVSCLFWPAVQTINFSLLPLACKAPYVAFASYIWSICLAVFQSKQKPCEENSISKVEQN